MTNYQLDDNAKKDLTEFLGEIWQGGRSEDNKRMVTQA